MGADEGEGANRREIVISDDAEQSLNRASVPWRLIGIICAARLAVYGLSAGLFAWGYMSDELYYIACAKRLAWGYVDHPPFSLVMLAAQRALLGDSLLALRFTPALLACGTALLTALLARELGGRRGAQALAALAAGKEILKQKKGHRRGGALRSFDENKSDLLTDPGSRYRQATG